MFTVPQVASVGTASGDQVVTAVHRIAGSRLSTKGRPTRPGRLDLAVGTKERVIVGAFAIGPEAGEWIGQLTLAVRARIPIDILLATTQPYPVFSEANGGLRALQRRFVSRRDPAAKRPASGICANGIRTRGFRSALKGPA